MVRAGCWLLASLACACRVDDPPSRRLLFDFENGEPAWELASGNLQAEPAALGATARRHGRRMLSTGASAAGKHDPAPHGVLASPSFTIDHPYLVFRSGGFGSTKQCWFELRDADSDERLRKVASTGKWEMQTHVVDVAAFRGKAAR